MNAKQINESFDLVGYIGGLVTLHKSGAYWIGACPMCGGRDRFNLKRTKSGDVWMCRNCQADKYHSAIDFLMEYHKESFREAFKRAGGEMQSGTPRTPASATPKNQPVEFPSQDWQAEAWQEVNAANDRLLGIPEGLDTIAYAVQLAKHNDSEIGRDGRAYLTKRGIDRAAWVCFNLGYLVVDGRPAIVMPYTDGRIITAVKYRFLDNNNPRLKCKPGSKIKDSIFGLQNYNPSNKTLVIVEGEINAISLWQVVPPHVTVVSCGGETNGHTPMLRVMTNRFEKIIIWMDEAERAESLRRYLGRPEARTLRTPRNVGGVDKWDANQMLQAGYLAEFIRVELQDVRVSA